MADVYVSPTQFETFGLAIAEGMANGKPAVVYEIGGTPEVMNDGYSGYLATYENPKDMYEKINILDKDRSLLKRMSSQAREWVQNTFSNERMVKELEEIYNSVLSK